MSVIGGFEQTLQLGMRVVLKSNYNVDIYVNVCCAEVVFRKF